MSKDTSPDRAIPLDTSGSGIDRRSFLGRLGVGSAAAVAFGASTLGEAAQEGSEDVLRGGPKKLRARRAQALRVRREAAHLAWRRPLPEQIDNGEEKDYPYIASFSKGLPHNSLGEVDGAAYRSLLNALESGAASAFEAVPLGGERKLRNPQAGRAFDLEGPDCGHTTMRPAPRIDGPENSSEMGELYWMALARDIAFTDYGTDSLIASAGADMNNFSDFRGPQQGGHVTPSTLFRGNTPGDLTGPYVSQFLLRDIPYGTLTISQKQKTVMPGIDHATDPASWLSLQRGVNPSAPDAFDATPRYIRNGRDLAAYVHLDALYEAYLNACLILLGLGAPFDSGNPYLAFTKTDSFGTFGGPHILSLVTEVATRALKSVWFQKWYLHRRLRPETFGGRVHYKVTGAANYPIDEEILNSQGAARTYSQHGTYLLPQAFPEGSPLHPSYGSGHATVAGACVTILKAWFNESYVIPGPLVPDGDGLVLVPYTGSGADALTVGGELNKVAANIASGRNFGGIHWRSDFSEGLKLGEEIAIGLLEEQQLTYNEQATFTLTRFDGTTITI